MKNTYSYLLFLFFSCAFITTAQENKYVNYQKILLINNDSLKCAKLIDYAALVTDSISDYNFAELIFEKTNSLLKTKNYSTLQLKLNHKWAYTEYVKGNYSESDKLYVSALGSAILKKDPALKADILNKAGANLQHLSTYKRAMVYYNEALEIYSKLNDAKGKAMVYVNMANVFAASGDFEQSDQFFDKAGKLFEQNNLHNKYLVVLGNKAVIKWQLGKAEEAKHLFLRSLNFDFKKTADTHHSLVTCFNVGLIYSEIKQWDSCFYYLNRGKFLADSLELTAQYSGTYYYDMGYCYVNKGEPKKAIDYYKKALAIKNGISDYKSVYDNISKLYFKIKQYDTAFFYKDLSAKMADSIYKSELKEHDNFENKRVELLEKDYQNQVDAAEQKQFVSNLQKRNYLMLGAIVLLVLLILSFFLYFKQYKLKEKKEHLQSEIDFLKAQLNPHFLFNSLNNIYVLLDDNKDKASEILVKFSDLMRYQLYDCNVPLIALGHEIQFIENYIEFEKLRYSTTIHVLHNLKEIETGNLFIAPLLLQPFIENAFKHSPKNKLRPSPIHIHIALDGQNFLLEVSNMFNVQEPSNLPGGIGLENVKKRLKILYPNKHELKIFQSDGIFRIHLKITLSND